MSRRITGLETEYGCLVEAPLDPRATLERIRDWLFEDQRYGLIDLHDRDWDELAGNGGFLFNGGRVYIDMGHLEYCTPECASARDVVRFDRAGDLLLQEAVAALGLQGKVSFIRNNIDHYTGATFGCHENYSLDRRAPLHERNVLSLLAFLTLRVLFCGAGRVGAMRPGRPRPDWGTPGGRAGLLDPAGAGASSGEPTASFQISQRADYIQNDFFEWVQHNRAIINTRDEPLADPRLYRRLHLIHGDTNVLPSALFLKVGATRLVLDLLDADAMPDVALADAVTALRSVSRTLRPPWPVALVDGRTADALEVLDQFRSRAAELFRGRDAETDEILALWGRVQSGLGRDPSELVGLVDWVSKEYLLDEFRRAEGVDWGHAWLESQDLEFHQIDPERSLGMALASLDGYWSPPRQAEARLEPPADSRARARSLLMREIQAGDSTYFLDWEAVEIPNQRRARLADPFHPHPDPAGAPGSAPGGA